MLNHRPPQPEEVEHLLRNAQLRDELEPFLDESIGCVNVSEVPTPVENEFLASMLAWERAPTLPICQWFEPELKLAHPDTLSEAELHARLWEAIHRLYEKRIVLDFTDHLSDRELYCLIFRDILPSPEKKIEASANYLHWDCADVCGDPETWLRYYASDEERRNFGEDFAGPIPNSELPPHPRSMPGQPL